MEILSSLIEFLEDYSMPIDAVLYKKLKDKSPRFKLLLKQLGIDDFTLEEFLAFLKGEYDIYREVKCSNLSFRKCIELAKKYFNLLGIENPSSTRIEKRDKNKIKLLISNDQQLNEIFVLCIRMSKIVYKRNFQIAILSFSMEELQHLFEDYCKYKFCGLESNRDSTFLHTIIKRIELAPKTKAREKSPLTFGRKPPMIGKKVSPALVEKRFYNHFTLPDCVNSEEIRARIVDSIIISRSQITQNDIQNYMNDDPKISTAEFKNILDSLRKRYAVRLERYLHPIDKYDLFPLKGKISEEKRNDFVDQLFDSIDIELASNIEKALIGDPDISHEQFRIAERARESLLKTYDEYVDRHLHPKEICDLIPDFEDISLERKKEILIYVFAGFPEGFIKELEAFLKGQRIFTESQSIKMNLNLNVVRNHYLLYIKQISKEIYKFQNAISEKTGVVVENNLSFDTMYYLVRILRAIKRDYYRLYWEKDAYDKFFQETVPRIFLDNPTADLKNLIVQYVFYVYDEISKIEKEKTAAI